MEVVAEKNYYTVEDVMRLTDYEKSKAYQLIRELNEELNKKGYITIRGKVSKKYYHERVY